MRSQCRTRPPHGLTQLSRRQANTHVIHAAVVCAQYVFPPLRTAPRMFATFPGTVPRTLHRTLGCVDRNTLLVGHRDRDAIPRRDVKDVLGPIAGMGSVSVDVSANTR